jgi:tetratricopeptide (TPR) repeat protein
MSQFLRRKLSAVRGFAEAIALRRELRDTENKILSEYWISRSLFEAKLYHIAFAGFGRVLAYGEGVSDSKTIGIQSAAAGCMNRILEKFPTLETPQDVKTNIQRLLRIASSDEIKLPIREFGMQVVLELLGNGVSGVPELAMKIAENLGPSDPSHSAAPFVLYSQGMVALKQGKYAESAEKLEKFFAISNLPIQFKRYADHAHILLSRAYYGKRDYVSAEKELKRVKKSSNELAAVLGELAWAQLMEDQLPEAIGSAMNLQAGGLKKTFSPEAPMVMAMAMNELCQFPDSIRAIHQFRKGYKSSYEWLDSWIKNPKSINLYREAIAYIRKQSKVPDRIASEWIRSPIFYSNQEEINLLFAEKRSGSEMVQMGSHETRELAGEIRKLNSSLKLKIVDARRRLGEDDPLPQSLIGELEGLKERIRQYQNVRYAASTWRLIVKNHNLSIPQIEKALMAKIERFLLDRNHKMHTQLQEIAENNQLIEIEIFQGASQDIIWQNAHPEYKKVAQDLNEDQKKEESAKVWDWGRAPAQAEDGEERVEIWEDELGSFKANLFDNCSNKDKYLALKRRR